MDARIKARIAALHAHAESAAAIGSQEEAAAYAARVGELLAEYELTLADLGQPAGDDYGQTELTAPQGHAGRLWYLLLVQEVAAWCGCTDFIMGYHNGVEVHFLVGLPTHREACRELVERLSGWAVAEVRTLAAAERRRRAALGQSLGSFTNDWLSGFAVGVKMHLDALRAAPAVGTALVLDRGRAAEEWLEAQYRPFHATGQQGPPKDIAAFIGGSVAGTQQGREAIRRDGPQALT